MAFIPVSSCVQSQESDAVLGLVDYAPGIEGKRKSLTVSKSGLQQVNQLLREVLG